MPPDQDSFTDRACAAAEAYARQNYDFTIRHDIPAFSQGGSHRVVRGLWRGKPVVFKYYAYGNDQSRVWEAAALRHFAAIPCLPRLIDDRPERALIISEIDGEPLTMYEDVYERRNNVLTLTSLWQQIGGLVAQMSKIPVRHEDLDAARQFVADDMACAWNVYRSQPNFQTPFFERSLRLQEKHIREGVILPLCLCHRDMNPGNILADGARLSGVVDLESCRPGSITEQVGIVLYAIAAYLFAHAPGKLLWNTLEFLRNSFVCFCCVMLLLFYGLVYAASALASAA